MSSAARGVEIDEGNRVRRKLMTEFMSEKSFSILRSASSPHIRIALSLTLNE